MSSPESEKLRRIHMDAASCSEFASTSKGIQPLVAPGTVVKSSKDLNRGLYPKTEKTKPTGSHDDKANFPSFIKASEIDMKRKRHPSKSSVNVENKFLPFIFSSEMPQSFENVCDTVTLDGSEPTTKRKKKDIPSQCNKITNYILHKASSASRFPKDCGEAKCHKSISKARESTCVTLSSSAKSGVESEETGMLGPIQLSSRSSDRNEWQDFETEKPEYFGLFGTTDADESPEPDHFHKLPVEVLERIFCELPFLDLQKCKRVCRLWNNVITNECFIPWKIRYYKLKYGDEHEEEMMGTLLKSVDGHSVENCLHALIRYMKVGFPRKAASDTYDKLRRHHKFLAAESVLKERFPDWSENLNPWCIIAIIVLLSEQFSDVSDIIRYLLSSDSMSLPVDILEALYCIASFLFYCMNLFKINHGLHYRVYHSLYMYENHIPAEVEKSVQRTDQRHPHTKFNAREPLHLTPEQNRIVSHNLQSGDVVKVIAFAGCGKTSTLIELARHKLPSKIKFLNIMFNKSVCDHAKQLFPDNVRCQTAHSLAYAAVGRKFCHRLTSKFSPDAIKSCLKLSEYPVDSYLYCKTVIAAIHQFMASADVEISIKHSPRYWSPSKDRVNFTLPAQLRNDQRLHVCMSAAKIWELLTDPKETCLITHDVYLKLYQLSKPVINKFDCIMVDEAQDCNPAMLDIVLSQKVPVILVGDPHQQIYEFRGSKNALKDVKSTHTYHLTRSFRFGPEIAYIASCCIEVLKDYKQETLVGCNKPSTVSGVVAKGQYAIISRSNLGVFNEAIRLCCQKNYKYDDEPRDFHGAFIGGIEKYGLNQIVDIYRLKSLQDGAPGTIKPEEWPTDKFIRNFQNLRCLMSYARKKDDMELSYKIELVMQYNERIPEYMATLRRKCSSSLELANVVFTTAHKAKGFEFETVRLGDDYNVGFNPISIAAREAEEEYNILYVALTRAKHSLFLTEKLYNVLLCAQEKFEYPVPSQDLMQYPSAPNCVLCFTPIDPHVSLSLVRRKVTLTSGRILRGGPLCMKCGSAPYYRPQIVRDPVIMYLDPMEDYAHKSLRFLVGPLPSDSPLSEEYDPFGELQELDLIYVINAP